LWFLCRGGAQDEDDGRGAGRAIPPAKAEAALRGRKLKDLIEEGLRLVLASPQTARKRSSLAELMKDARGVADSGVWDLASNPEHLAGFGR
jgi:hypothetical protein